MNQPVQEGPTLRELLALIPIPENLSTAQRHGNMCVWGTEIASTATAVDLGPRTLEEGGSTVAIFPRVCRRCLTAAAMNGFYAHVEECETCRSTMADEPLECAYGRGLYHLATKGTP
ncbi:MAG TPA: hypothetical protein VIU15_39705 [Streptomyces sp.]